MPARHMDVVRCLHEPTACGVQAPAIALLRRMTAIGLMVRPTLRQQYAPLACLLVAFDIQAPAFPPLIKRHGGLQARQRRAALVPSCNELLAGRRKNLRHAGIRCCPRQIWAMGLCPICALTESPQIALCHLQTPGGVYLKIGCGHRGGSPMAVAI